VAKQTWGAIVGEYTSLAFLLPAATFTGYAIGWALDRAFGTTWLYIPGLLLGIASGLVQLVRLLMRDTGNNGE
jgi:F0F1-type ATP synthase assembly protein I